MLTSDDRCLSCKLHISDTSDYAFYATPANHELKRKKSAVQNEFALHKQRLIDERRLILILDIDSTLLHATTLLVNPSKDKNVNLQPPESDIYECEVTYPVSTRFLIKFRPNLREFLLEAHKYFEIHLYTMANSEYANRVVSLISEQILKDVDPQLKARIIANRVITRNHSGDHEEAILKERGGYDYHTKLKSRIKDIQHLFDDPSMVVVIDDSEMVWPNDKDNLIHISPFLYWAFTQDLNKTFHNLLPSAPKSTSSNSNTKKRTPTQEEGEGPPTKKFKTEETELSESHFVEPRISVENNEADQLSISENSDQLVGSINEGSTELKNIEIESKHENNDGVNFENTDGISGESIAGKNGESNGKSIAGNNIGDSEDELLIPPPRVSLSDIPGIERSCYGSPIQCLKPYYVWFQTMSSSDTVLLGMKRVLASIHEQYFALPEGSPLRSVRRILPQLKSLILRNFVISFSGVFPKLPPLIEGLKDPHRSDRLKQERELTKLALFGAKTTDLEAGNPNGVTHLVIEGDKKTSKFKIATETPHIYLVHRSWLESTFMLWQKQNEENFPYQENPVYYCEPPRIETPESFWDGYVEKPETTVNFNSDKKISVIPTTDHTETDMVDFSDLMDEIQNDDDQNYDYEDSFDE